MTDFETDGVRVKGYERYVCGVTDLRGVIGTDPYPMTAGLFLWPADAEARGYDMAVWRGPYQLQGGRLW